MTKEEKQLLLKDLCARLPYNVVIRCTDNDTDYKCFLTTDILNELQHNYEYYDYKPYLRPMSSMTKEEKKEYHKQVDIDLEKTAEVVRKQFEAGTFHPENKFTPQYYHIDWLNAHHFDYRGLIEKGLALEAKEGMYE